MAGVGTHVAGPHAARELARGAPRRLEVLVELLAARSVAGDEAGPELVLELVEPRAARPVVAGQRHVERARGLEPEDLAHGQEVERGLEAAVALPAAPGWARRPVL